MVFHKKPNNIRSQWSISSEEFSLHRVQFENLNPKNGYINGTKAKEYFTKSKLSNVILAQIWNLADVVFYFVPMHKTN